MRRRGELSVTLPPPPDLMQPTEMKLMYNCRDEGYRSVSVFTIKAKKRLIGIFNLYFHKARGFTPMEVHLLEAVGQHLGAAIEGQRLVSREKEMAISEERNLLAQELHDSIAQGLAFLIFRSRCWKSPSAREMTVKCWKACPTFREGVQESYDDVRELLVHFRTRVHQSDLEGAIRGTLQKFEGQTGIKTTINISGTGAPLDPSNETQMLHIVQEALSNVRKHAAASAVALEISRHGDCVISVRDNGRGFNPELQPGDSHVGISIMKERAHRIGGGLEILSDAGCRYRDQADPEQILQGSRMKPIRVLIVDDHTLFRSGIRLLLQRQKGFEVVGEAGDGLEGVKRAKSLKPDVVLLDLHMPGISGREAVRLIAEDTPETRVVMLTVSEDAEGSWSIVCAQVRRAICSRISKPIIS